MYCDFFQGLEVVSSVHILPTDGSNQPPGRHPGRGPGRPAPPPNPASPATPPRSSFRSSGPPDPVLISSPLPPPKGPHPPHFPTEPRPPNWRGTLLDTTQRGFEAFQAGAWHRRAPGEVRVHIDASRLVSLYDPALRSGAIARKGHEKVLHRGKGLSEDDITTWRGWITEVLQPSAPETSGVDWQALTTVIMDRYGARLEYLRILLEPGRAAQNTTAAVQAVRTQLMVMLSTDLTPDTIPINITRNGSSPTRALQYSQAQRHENSTHEWVKPIATHCSSFLVSHLPHGKFTREERTLYAGVSGTLREICRVLSLLWADAYDPSPEFESDLIVIWRTRVNDLMEWLDWTMWNRCTPACDPDVSGSASLILYLSTNPDVMFVSQSLCFIPTWPLGIGRGEEDLSKVNWTPKCISRGKWGPSI